MSDDPANASSAGGWSSARGPRTHSAARSTGPPPSRTGRSATSTTANTAPAATSAAGSGQGGGLGDSQLTVPDWINAVHTLFPKRTIERIEKDALERYQLDEMVTNPDLLRRARPSMTLLKAVLHTKHLMNQEVLALARDLVRKVVEELMEKLARPVEAAFLGAVDRQRRSRLKVAKNFDAETTIRRNLARYDPKTKQLSIETPFFFSRIRRQADRWQVIILVDESGSMADSVIHAAVTAAIFFGIKALRTHLCLFDTNVVDVTDQCNDPVETIMKVQLGGGTDIGGALAYAARPRRIAPADDRRADHRLLRGCPRRSAARRRQGPGRERRDPARPGGARRARRAELRSSAPPSGSSPSARTSRP